MKSWPKHISSRLPAGSCAFEKWCDLGDVRHRATSQCKERALDNKPGLSETGIYIYIYITQMAFLMLKLHQNVVDMYIYIYTYIHIKLLINIDEQSNLRVWLTLLVIPQELSGRYFSLVDEAERFMRDVQPILHYSALPWTGTVEAIGKDAACCWI